MTEPTLPTYEVLSDGTHLFTMLLDDARLEIVVFQHHPGYLLTETVAKLGQDRVVNRGRIDLLNLQDRERFCRGAIAVDGVVNWDHWLRFALEHVRMSLAASPLPDKEPQGRSGLAVDLSTALVNFHDMLQLTLPERTRYLPWLPERGLAM